MGCWNCYSDVRGKKNVSNKKFYEFLSIQSSQINENMLLVIIHFIE